MQEPKANLNQGWLDLFRRVRQTTMTRRHFIPRAAAAGLALTQLLPPGAGHLISPAAAAGLPDLATWPSNNKIKHVVILCQENRSFDHYFGAFASSFGSGKDTALGFNPAALTYQNGSGQKYHPIT
jgi:phospholipase C